MEKLIEFYKKYKHIIHITIIIAGMVLLFIFGQKIIAIIFGAGAAIIKFFAYKKKEKELIDKINSYDSETKLIDERIEKLLVELKFTQEERIKIVDKLKSLKFEKKNYTRAELLKWANGE